MTKREYIESFGENKGDEECDKCKGICYMCGVLDFGFTREGIWKELVYRYKRKT